MTETGGRSEPSPRKDVSGLIARRLNELARVRGSEQAEQVATEKATGRPLPAALVLFRRLGEIEREYETASLDQQSRREFAILRYACGLAVLGELMRQDAELTVIYNRHQGRPVSGILLVTDPQSEVVQALETQRKQLAEAFPTAAKLPLPPRQHEVVSGLAGRVGISSFQPTEHLPLDPKTFSWPTLRAQREAATIREAAGPDPATRRNVIVNSPYREISEPSPREDVGALVTRRLDELARERGSEFEEQVREEKATGRPLPEALILLRRLGEVEQDVAGRDEHSRQDFAMMRYACGLAVLGELVRKDALRTVRYNRDQGRPLTDVLLLSDEQSQAVEDLEAQRQRLTGMFPAVSELPISPRQQTVVTALVSRVGISRAHPTEHLPLDPKTFSWPTLRAQREAATIREAAGPGTGRNGSGTNPGQGHSW